MVDPILIEQVLLKPAEERGGRDRRRQPAGVRAATSSCV